MPVLRLDRSARLAASQLQLQSQLHCQPASSHGGTADLVRHTARAALWSSAQCLHSSSRLSTAYRKLQTA
jgi:hypothetical protein